MKPTLYIMCGVSYAGKSIAARNIAEFNNATIVSTDAIRGELFGDENNQQDGAEVFNIAYERVAHCLNLGQNVVFDATNLRVKDRKKLLTYLNKKVEGGRSMYEVIAVALEIPPANIMNKRMELRKRKVPIDVVLKQIDNYQKPTLNEDFEEVRYIKGGWLNAKCV